ncbi:MAG: spore coat protein [Clostridia bacterium]|nr:spore coat protein [Clostridia bacterium]
MAQITCKELSALSDLLTMEENMVAKCKHYASMTNDTALKNRCEQMAQRHQRHFDELYANLK